LKKTGKLNLNRETLRDFEREIFGPFAVFGGSLEPGATHVTVSNTATTVGSGTCRV
jgi:hypothetical protein